ncbi:hypothetical protein ABZ208_11040 [Streptomyces sp. NPDC006208]|uniref:hypothetical protein n=1 Tax=Streptomyces sp. NPDC006208 TaxID=3156734 RepID=UPI0033B69947
MFRALGPVSLAYALCGLATGALAGLLLRRALPAAGLALLTTIVLNALGDRYRERLWPILESPILDRVTAGDPMSAWSVDNGGHPPSHFWPLQLVETGIVLTLTAALTTAAFVVLRRRHG